MPVTTLYRRILAKVLPSDKEAYPQVHPPRAQGFDANNHQEAAPSRPPRRGDRRYASASATHTDDSNSKSILEITEIDQLFARESVTSINLHASSGFFANTNSPIFNGQVNMYDIMLSNQPVLQRLIEKGKPEAIHDSDHREYPPRCSENTRVSLRNDILEWRRNPNRQKRMRWYMGPPAIGKSAIAQSVAEELERTGHLGGSFFFSRPAKIDDPATVIPTLAYQLATRNQLYKKIVTQRLSDDPLIPNKNRSTQFNKLIIEPFQTIAIADSSIIEDPILIILDGLDECNGKVAQCELVQLILDHVGRVKQFPLLWLICSRPEWHFRTIVSDADFPAAYEKREIDVDDEEARADAKNVLETELNKIRNEYVDCLPEDWPPTEDLNCLFSAASGHLGFASFMARFIGDAEVGDPAKQFHVCIRMVSGLGVDQGTRVNPLEALDRLYQRILSDIPPEILPVTMRILGLFISGYAYNLQNTRDHANFLSLSQTSFNGALKQLHSVAYVPPLSEAPFQLLRFYHTSFIDFLTDPIRSGNFHLSKGAIYLGVAVQCLRWLGNHNHQLSDVNDPVFGFTRWVGWLSSRQVPVEFFPSLMDELASFDFGSLRDPDMFDFVAFIHWLNTTAPPNSLLVRLTDEPINAGVRTLTLKCEIESGGWISDFFAEDGSKQSPLSFHFLLGVATQLHVHLAPYP